MPDQHKEDASLVRIRAADECVRTRPPRCLIEFQIEPSSLQGVVFDGHGEPLNVVFELRCSCKHDQFIVLGHHKTNRGHAIFVSPLALHCSRCEKTTELFDTAQHGYDPEVSHKSYTIRGEGERTPFACPRCGIQPVSAHARFEHSNDILDDSYGDFSEKHKQDLFTWFSLVGECSGCQQVLHIADFECA